MATSPFSEFDRVFGRLPAVDLSTPTPRQPAAAAPPAGYVDPFAVFAPNIATPGVAPTQGGMRTAAPRIDTSLVTAAERDERAAAIRAAREATAAQRAAAAEARQAAKDAPAQTLAEFYADASGTPVDATPLEVAEGRAARSGGKLRIDPTQNWLQVRQSPEWEALPIEEQARQRVLWIEARIAEGVARLTAARGGKPPTDKEVAAMRQRIETDVAPSVGAAPKRTWWDSDVYDAAKNQILQGWYGRQLVNADNPEEAAAAIQGAAAAAAEYDANMSAFHRNNQKKLDLRRQDMMAENAAAGRAPELSWGQEVALGYEGFSLDPWLAVLGNAPATLVGVGAALAGAVAGSLAGPAGTAAGAAAAGAGVGQEMSAAFIAAETAQRVRSMPLADLEQSPRFRELLAFHNGNEAVARTAFTQEIVDAVETEARLVGAATGVVEGAIGAGRVVLGAAGRTAGGAASGAVGRALANAGLASANPTVRAIGTRLAASTTERGALRTAAGVAAPFAGEAGQEFAEEFGEQVVGNLALQRGGLEQDLTEGAFEAGTMGALTGAGTTAGVQVLARGARAAAGPVEDQGDVVVTRDARGRLAPARRSATADGSNLAMNPETGLARLRDLDAASDPGAITAMSDINAQLFMNAAITDGVQPVVGELAGRAASAVLLGDRAAQNPPSMSVDVGGARTSFVFLPDGTVSVASPNVAPEAVQLAQTATQMLAPVVPQLQQFGQRTSGYQSVASAQQPVTPTPSSVAPQQQPVAQVPVAPAPVVPAQQPPEQFTPTQAQDLERQRQQALATRVTDPFSGLPRGVMTSAADVAAAARQAQQSAAAARAASDAAETRAIEAMLAEDTQAAEQAALSAAQEAAVLRQAAEQETDAGTREALAVTARRRVLDSLLAAYAEPNQYFASRVLPAVDQQLAVLGEQPMSVDERNRMSNVLGSARTFTNNPSLPADPQRAVDPFADNSQMENLIRARALSAAGQNYDDPSAAEAQAIVAGARQNPTLAAFASWFARNAPDAAQRQIARQVATRLRVLESAGVTTVIDIVESGDRAPQSMDRARGLATISQPPGGTVLSVLLKGPSLPGDVGASYGVALHELVHAATLGMTHAVNNNLVRNQELVNAVADLYEVHNAIVRAMNARFDEADAGGRPLTAFERAIREGRGNAFQNPDETLAWALSSTDAQQWLETVPYRGTTLWNAFVQAVRRLMGLPPAADTALSGVLQAADSLFGVRNLDYLTVPLRAAAPAMSVQVPRGALHATGSSTASAENTPTLSAATVSGQPPGDARAAARAGVIPPAASAGRGAQQAAAQRITAALTGRRPPPQRRRDALPYLRQMSDAVTEWLADAMLPMVRWVQALPVPAGMRDAILNAMYLAPNVRDAITTRAMEQFGGNELRDAQADLLRILRQRDATAVAEDVPYYAGYWLTGRYAVIKNARMLQAAEDTMLQAQQDLDQARQAGAPAREQARLQRLLDEATEAFTDRQFALAQGDQVNEHVGPAGRPVGLAGGMNNAQAAGWVADAERRFGRGPLEQMARHVYRLNSYRLAVDLESGRTTPEVAERFSPETQRLRAEMDALVAAANGGTQAQLEAAREDFVRKLAATSLYVPTTGTNQDMQWDALGQGLALSNVLGGGYHAPNVARDRRLEGRQSIADDGITASLGGVSRSAAAAGWDQFTREIENAYNRMTDAQRRSVGMERVNLSALDRLDDNLVIRGDYGYRIANGQQLAALRKENVDDRSRIWSILEVPTRTFAYAATQLNPVFGIYNMVRDVWERSELLRTRPLVAANGNAVDSQRAARRMVELAASGAVFRDLRRATPMFGEPSQAARNSRYAQLQREFFELGGGGSRRSEMLARDRRQLVTDIENANSRPRQAMRAIGQVVSRWNEVFDSVAGVSAYAALLEQGMDRRAAAAAALDLMNFRKGGSAMPAIRAFYAFAQPAVTGGANLIRALRTPTGQKRFLGYLVAFAALQSLMASLAGDDDELGRNKLDLLDEYTLDRSLPIPIPGTDTVVKMPLGFGLPMLANIITRQAAGFAKGDQTLFEAVNEAVGRGVVPAFTPFEDVKLSAADDPMRWLMQTFSPTVLRPATNIAINRSGLGGQVVRDEFFDENQYKAVQGAPMTPEFYKELAASIQSTFGIDLAPEQVREVVRGYSLGIFRSVLQTAVENPHKELTGRDTELPIIRTLVSGYNSNALITEMGRFEGEGRSALREANAQAARLAAERGGEVEQYLPEAITGLDAREQEVVALYQQWVEAEKELRKESAALTRAGVPRGVNEARLAQRDAREAVQANFVRQYNALDR